MNENDKLTIPSCNNPDTNEEIAQAHSIETDEYNILVSSFFGVLIPDPKELPMDSPYIDYTKDCTIYGIKIVIDPTNHDNNDDITISMCLFTDLQKPHTDHFIMHSIHLFKGLRDALGVVTLHLHKAYRVEDGHNIPTVALKGINNKGVEVYWGDLSSMIPLIGSE
ncbi:MAG: hypothetical protein ABIQ40_03840 [Bacteroidia bacterium]